MYKYTDDYECTLKKAGTKIEYLIGEKCLFFFFGFLSPLQIVFTFFSSVKNFFLKFSLNEILLRMNFF